MNFRFSMFIFALVIMTFSSCKDEDNSELIVGNWQADSFSQSNCNDASDNLSYTFGDNGQYCEDFIIAEVCVNIDFTFSSTGTLAAIINAESNSPLVPSETTNLDGTWEILDETTMTVCLDGTCSIGTYTVTSNKMTYSGNDADTGCNVSLTATKQ
ncbi:MAG: hypothetical protein ACI94Y_002125 [Maribacter sp.]|jgi:hypothetical protein